MDLNQEKLENYSQPQVSHGGYHDFRRDFKMTTYQTSKMTYVFAFLMVLYVSQGFLGGQEDFLATLNEGMRMFVYITTIAFQWFIFGIMYLTMRTENTDLGSLALNRIRTIDFAWSFATLLVLAVTGVAMSLFVEFIGHPMPGELAMLLPQDLLGKFVWVGVSFTAGFCEETLFRGYIMTRIREIGKFSNWTIPVIVSSIAFGLPHAYQGIGGLIVITSLGVVFALVYIRTKSLWPAVIAHSLLDFLNIFFPQ